MWRSGAHESATAASGAGGDGAQVAVEAGAPLAIHASRSAVAAASRRAFGAFGIGLASSWMRTPTSSKTRRVGSLGEGARRSSRVTSGIGAP